MKKSKYAKNIKISKDVYAIFNNLVMKPIFLNKNYFDYFKNNEFDKFSKEEIELLLSNGLLVNNNITDKKALDFVRKNIDEEVTKNRIVLMYIIPNNNCNLMCKYCFIGKLNNQHPIKMNTETLYNAIDKFYNHLKDINYHEGKIIFYGGEPLISFDLIEKCVNYINENNYDIMVNMVTNGTLLTEKMADFFKDNNVGIGISIDGPKDITDKNRIYYNDFLSVYDKTFKSIEMLQNKNIEFNLSITIANDLLQNQEEFLKWIKSINVKNIAYNILHYTSPTDEWKKYYREATKFLIKSNNELFNLGINDERINRKYTSFYNNEFKFQDCGAKGGNQICISPDGNIDICHALWNNSPKNIGNIKDIEFDDIFKTAEFYKWQNNITLNYSKCLKCPALFICGGGCSYQSKSLFGSENDIDLPFCIHSKMMLKYILTEMYIEKIKQNSTK